MRGVSVTALRLASFYFASLRLAGPPFPTVPEYRGVDEKEAVPEQTDGTIPSRQRGSARIGSHIWGGAMGTSRPTLSGYTVFLHHWDFTCAMG